MFSTSCNDLHIYYLNIDPITKYQVTMVTSYFVLST